MTTPAGTGRLVVDRPNAIWGDRGRKYDILVDGALAGKVAPGGELVFDLAPGFHQVQARLGGTGSPPFGLTVIAGGYFRLRVDKAGATYERYRRFSKASYLRLTPY